MNRNLVLEYLTDARKVISNSSSFDDITHGGCSTGFQSRKRSFQDEWEKFRKLSWRQQVNVLKPWWTNGEKGENTCISCE